VQIVNADPLRIDRKLYNAGIAGELGYIGIKQTPAVGDSGCFISAGGTTYLAGPFLRPDASFGAAWRQEAGYGYSCGAAIFDVDIPGLEWTMPANLLHYAFEASLIHYAMPRNLIHYHYFGDPMGWTMPLGPIHWELSEEDERS
jgi:hypothetical protein